MLECYVDFVFVQCNETYEEELKIIFISKASELSEEVNQKILQTPDAKYWLFITEFDRLPSYKTIDATRTTGIDEHEQQYDANIDDHILSKVKVLYFDTFSKTLTSKQFFDDMDSFSRCNCLSGTKIQFGASWNNFCKSDILEYLGIYLYYVFRLTEVPFNIDFDSILKDSKNLFNFYQLKRCVNEVQDPKEIKKRKEYLLSLKGFKQEFVDRIDKTCKQLNISETDWDDFFKNFKRYEKKFHYPVSNPMLV